MKNIEKAKVIFLDRDKECYLGTKPKSNCHFFEQFEAGDDSIQLRLDWNDLDENGYPILDADFYNLKTGKRRKLTGKRKDSHHTKAIENEGRTYEWKFEETNLKFKVVLYFRVSIVDDIGLSESFNLEVEKAKPKAE